MVLVLESALELHYIRVVRQVAANVPLSEDRLNLVVLEDVVLLEHLQRILDPCHFPLHKVDLTIGTLTDCVEELELVLRDVADRASQVAASSASTTWLWM